MIEMRRVRFGNVDGLKRAHLGTAGEVWLGDLCTAVWVTRDAMKLGALLARYMLAPDSRLLMLSSIEAQIQVGGDEIKFAMRLMQLYRAVEAYSVEADGLRAALHLTTMQRLRVLDAHHQIDVLMQLHPADPEPLGAHWVPRQTEDAEEAAAPKAAASRRSLWAAKQRRLAIAGA